MRDDTLILCYHAVSEEWPSELAVTPAALRDQVRFLLDSGYRAVNFSEAVLSPPPGRVLSITFDDAYKSVFRLARPLLAELGVPATLFVPTDFPESGIPFPLPGGAWLGTEYEDELTVMDWGEIRQLRDEGWEIGSHSCSHPWLTQTSDAQLADELQRSKQVFTAAMGEPCRSIAYPYGDHDDRVVAATAAAGYETACTVPHRFERFETSPLRYGRIDVTRSESSRAFRLRTAVRSRRARMTSAARAAHWLDTHRLRRSSVLAAIRSQRLRLARARALRESCSNWRRLLTAQLAGRPLSRLRLRSGVDFRFARADAANTASFDGVFVSGAETGHLELPTGGLLVDVGAGEGLFAIAALQRGCARAICVEPDPDLAAALQANVERNRLDRISVLAVQPDWRPDLDRLCEGETIGFLRLATAAAGAAIVTASDQALGRIERVVAHFDPQAPGPRVDEIVSRLQRAGFATWLDIDHDSGAGRLSAKRR